MTKRKRLDLGQSDFKNIISNNNYFVDKSLFIEEVIRSERSVLLLPRPRRFGKTLNLTMLRYFFDKNRPENKELFKDLNIWQADDEIKAHCCKYPVIFLSFKDAKAQNWDDCYNLMKTEIAKSYKQHIYLLESDTVFDFEKNEFEKILSKKANNIDYQSSLILLSELLYRFHKEKVVILIDEYDTPIQTGYNKFYKETVSFMRGLLGAAFKDNQYLYKGVITGILRVSKESIFSGLNNISVYSVVNHDFADKFGFTQTEVDKILTDFELTQQKDEVQKWYNGYQFGHTQNIYNPWSILSYAATPQDGFRTYWANTSSNELIKNQIKRKDAQAVRKELMALISGKTVEKDIVDNFIFPNLDTDNDLLWSLLVFSGYLTTAKMVKLERYELLIPNYELKHIFTKTLVEWLNNDIKIQKTLLEDTIKYLINNEQEKFEKGFQKIMGDTFSYYDTAKMNEYVYQSYVLGLLAILSDDYIIKSNRESGEGRYDIMLIPHDKSRFGIVTEIKQTEKRQKKESNEAFNNRINSEIEKAAAQISDNRYFQELIDYGLPEKNIVKLPIIFAGKMPYVLKIK